MESHPRGHGGQGGQGAQVFVSYARTDTEFVDRLERDLATHGIQAWIDRRRLEGGQRWPREITEAISQCDSMLVVLSPQALTSAWVRKEYRLALRKRKRVIPLLYHPITTAQVPRELQDHQRIDFQAGMTFEQRYPERLQELLAALLPARSVQPIRPSRPVWARKRAQPPASGAAITEPETTEVTPGISQHATTPTSPTSSRTSPRQSRKLHFADRWLLAFSVSLALAAGVELAITCIAAFGHDINMSLIFLGLIEGVILVLFTLLGGFGITAPIQRRGRIPALRRIVQGLILTTLLLTLHLAVVAYASRFGIVVNTVVYAALIFAVSAMLLVIAILAVANLLA